MKYQIVKLERGLHERILEIKEHDGINVQTFVSKAVKAAINRHEKSKEIIEDMENDDEDRTF